MKFESVYKSLFSFLLKTSLILWLIVNPGALFAMQCSSIFEEAHQASKKAEFVEALSYWEQLFEDCPQYSFGSKTYFRSFALQNFEEEISDKISSTGFFSYQFKSHLDRGLAAAALNLWDDAETEFNWILKRNPENPYALYNLGSISLSKANWIQALEFFNRASLAKSDFLLALSNQALTLYQLGHLDQAELELRGIVQKYPMFADARAALSALLWHKGFLGEAKSNWAAAVGLDNRYKRQDWLLKIRRWPPEPTKDLLAFLALENS